MNNEIKEKYLPIGTIVEVKEGTVPLMITGYCMKPQSKVTATNGETIEESKVFDYSACTFPVGITNTNFNLVFNHENIEKILYMGYESDDYKKYNEIVKQEIEKISKEGN